MARWFKVLPHGQFVGIVEGEWTSYGPGITAVSVASLRLVLTGVDRELVLLVDQPACGRHLGEEVAILLAAFRATPMILPEESAVVALRLPIGGAGVASTDGLAEGVPVIPLPVEAYEMMLGSR
jgi:hypothetical protein